MSFRRRLTSFFVLIVIVPMIGVGILVFSLISASQAGKANARAAALLTVANQIYATNVATARDDAKTIARDTSLRPGPALRARLRTVLAQTGVARIIVRRGDGSPPTSATRTA